MKYVSTFLLTLVLASSVLASEESALLALENSSTALASQTATGCRTECTYSEFMNRTTCQEVCDGPSVSICERTTANVLLLGCAAGAVMGGAFGLGVGGAAGAWAAAGCVGLGGFAYLLRASNNCPE